MRTLFIALLLSMGAPAFGLAPHDLDGLMAPVAAQKLWSQSRSAVQVVDAETGEVLFEKNATTAVTPASTMKAITSATALKVLGPSYNFTTELRATSRLDGAGVLRGDLYVVGHGDPVFVVEDLWKLVHDLKLVGVTRVAGDIIFDGRFFDTNYALPGWSKREDIENGPSYYSRMSALSLNYGATALVVRPGPEIGRPAVVTLETPADGYVVVENKLTTGAKKTRTSVKIQREVTSSSTHFTLTGSVPTDARLRRYYRTVQDPDQHFRAAFAAMAKAEGIRLDGKRKMGDVPDSARLLAQHVSPPLGSILMDMNKYSNNYMAEQILRTIGAESAGIPGTTEKGLDAVRTYLSGLGIDPDTYNIVNGSGLSRQAQIPPSVLTRVLVDMWGDPRVGREFAASLSIGGRDGTLRRRFKDQAGRIRGKTGTVDGVHGLTAYVEGADGHMYAFAFLSDSLKTSISQVKKVHAALVQQLFQLQRSDGPVTSDAEPGRAP